VALKFKVSVYVHSIGGIVVSNTAEGINIYLLRFLLWCVVSDLCYELIIRSEEYYRVCECVSVCLIVCDLEASKTNWYRLEVDACPIENKHDQLIKSVKLLATELFFFFNFSTSCK